MPISLFIINFSRAKIQICNENKSKYFSVVVCLFQGNNESGRVTKSILFFPNLIIGLKRFLSISW